MRRSADLVVTVMAARADWASPKVFGLKAKKAKKVHSWGTAGGGKRSEGRYVEALASREKCGIKSLFVVLIARKGVWFFW